MRARSLLLMGAAVAFVGCASSPDGSDSGAPPDSSSGGVRDSGRSDAHASSDGAPEAGHSSSSGGTSGSSSSGGSSDAGAGSSSGGSSSSSGAGSSSSSGSSGGSSSGGCAGTAVAQSGGTPYCSNSVGDAGNGYTYQLWSNGVGSGCMTVFGADATFKASWADAGDFLARVGLGFDETRTAAQIGTLSSDFAFTVTGTGGLGYIGIYGWSTNPLHEYYIVEDWIGSRPSPGTKVGTIMVDGAAYDVYTHTQTNQPAITGGNATFQQIFSVRQTGHTCGHISISDHFSQWATMGLSLGDLEEARLLVEAINNSGSIDFTTATVALQ